MNGPQRPPVSRTQENVASMSEDQFNASLDALLENDDLADGSDPLGTSNLSPLVTTEDSAANALHEEIDLPSGLHQSERPFVVATVSSMFSTTMSSEPEHRVSNQMTASSLPGLLGVRYATNPHTSLMPPQFQNLASRKRSMEDSFLQSCPPTKRQSFDLGSLPDTTEVSEDEGDRFKRRKDRNMREKQRSQQITSQISFLHDVLVEANIEHKPDKFSTLVCVENYIKNLQERSALLDSEHQKLIDTLLKTSEVVNSQYVPACTPNDSFPLQFGVAQPQQVADQYTYPQDQDNVFSGIDYKVIFDKCPFACSVASIDGRLVDLNKEFENMSGYTRQELMEAEGNSNEGFAGNFACPTRPKRNMSIFNLVARPDMENIFKAMSDMLRQPMVGSPSHTSAEDTWTDLVRFSRRSNLLRLSLSLVRTTRGRPYFFSCLLLPVEDDLEELDELSSEHNMTILVKHEDDGENPDSLTDDSG